MTKRVSIYRVAIADSVADLEAKMRRLLAEDFRPVGGVSVSAVFADGMKEPEYTYVQAVFKS